jgi:hypothetical protein
MKRLTPDEVEREIAALDSLDIAALQNRWRELYKVPPPFKVRSGFLRRAIAYRLQELVYGGLKPATRRELRRIAEEARINRARSHGEKRGDTDGLDLSEVPHLRPQRKILSPGTRLLREWNGRMESVEVTDDGFLWREKTYRTLSAVAVAITGTKWSGPKFFGLLGRRSSASVSAKVAHVASLQTTELPDG